MKKTLLALLLALICLPGLSQLTQVVHEYYGTRSSGEDVYRIFAELIDPTDLVSAVFAADNDLLYLGSDVGGIVNDGFGAITGDVLGTGFCAFSADICLDSYVTIGHAGSPVAGTTLYWDDITPIECGQPVNAISTLPNASAFNDSFGSSGTLPNLELTDGSWFATNMPGCNDQGLAFGMNNRVLIAQIAVPAGGDLEYGLNIQIHNDADGADLLEYVWNEESVDLGQSMGCGLKYPPLPDFDCWFEGCTDVQACNYDSSYLIDDGSCVFPGCLDSTACNYDPQAGCDSEMCCYGICGCTDSLACNYLSAADCDDGSCEYEQCADDLACNYVTDAPCENNSLCVYPGCLDESACNYDSGAGCEDSSCFYPSCSDPEACNYDSEYLCEDNSECQYPSISGVLFNDANQNGFLDNLFFNEPGLSGWQITIPELNLQVYTNSDGEFEFNDLPIGDYVVLVEVIEEGWSATTPLSVEVFDCGGNVNFGFAADGSPPFWVAGPCCIWMMDIHCDNGFNPGLWINNSGSVPLNGTVTVSFDPVLEAVELFGAVSPSDISPGVVTWDLEDSPVGGESLLFQCHIVGPGLEYVGQEFPINIEVSLTDEGEEFYYNSWLLEPIVVCAYDPNDKYPADFGYTDEHFILPGDEIEYRIRFQNTGNFPAEDIVVTDHIDTTTLDMDSFQPWFASHDFMTSVHADGQVDFIFDDIFLPDSASNEPGSQGYVVFKINAKSELEPLTEINNTAEIYFDSNPPIITNTTWHTIMDCSEVADFSLSETALCVGDILEMETLSPYADSVQWYVDELEAGVSNIEFYNVLDEGNFSILVEVSNPLCEEQSDQFIDVYPIPEASFDADGNTLTASAGSFYQWYLNGNPIDGAINQTYQITESGEYSVEVTNEWDCAAVSDGQMVTFTSVEIVEENGFEIYPNPASDQVRITTPDEGLYHLRMYDSRGKLVMNIPQFRNDASPIDLQNLSQGQYVITITQADSIVHKQTLTITDPSN